MTRFLNAKCVAAAVPMIQRIAEELLDANAVSAVLPGTLAGHRPSLKAPLPEGLRWEIRKPVMVSVPGCHDRPVR
ncbi:hypothetical protein ABZ468_54415 [Streptomyces sp. NPDC005708]|uniref:hypothetical protein n=1 Tax=Streptomyces sp. NPDC005708 TaxID=3154564 RepID=UPI0033FFC9FE